MHVKHVPVEVVRAQESLCLDAIEQLDLIKVCGLKSVVSSAGSRRRRRACLLRVTRFCRGPSFLTQFSGASSILCLLCVLMAWYRELEP